MKRAAISAFLLAALAISFIGQAAATGEDDSPWKNPVRRLVLDNGLVLLYQKDDSSSITALEVLIKGGKRTEPEGMAGIAYLSTRLILEMPDNQSARRLMVQASPLSLSCQGDFCLIEVEALSKHFEETLRLLSRPLLWPLFTGIRIEPLKRFMGHLRERETEEALSLGRAMQFRAMFGPWGYGASAYGTDESVRAIKSRDLVRFYEDHFRSDNVILAVVSDREAGDVSALLQKYLKDIRPGGPPQPPPMALTELPGQELRAEKDTHQSFISAAYLLPGVDRRLFALAALAESLLGKGVASRLWRLRQEEKLAYNVSCNFIPLRDAGVLEAYLETENEKLDRAREAFMKVLEDVSSRGVEAAELEAAKNIALTDFLRDNESKNGRAMNLAVYEALGLGHDFLERIPTLFAAVSLEEMNVFLAGRLKPEKAAMAVISGTKKKSPSPAP